MSLPTRWEVEYATATPRTWTVYELVTYTGGTKTATTRLPVVTVTEAGELVGHKDIRARLEGVAADIRTTAALSDSALATETLQALIVTTLALIN